MADKKEVVFTAEQAKQFSQVETLVLSAVSARCAGCSTRNVAPNRIASAVVNGNLSMEGAAEVAARFSSCQGLFDETLSDTAGEEFVVKVCHYPPAPKE